MPKKIISKFCVAAALVAGLAVSAMPAYAGFEWVAPNDGASNQQGSYAPPPAPAASSVPEIISPVIISGDSRSQPLSLHSAAACCCSADARDASADTESGFCDDQRSRILRR